MRNVIDLWFASGKRCAKVYRAFRTKMKSPQLQEYLKPILLKEKNVTIYLFTQLE